MAQSSTALLRCENLAKSYISAGRELEVFSDLNLSVEPGERLAIIGESGSGKSTLLHLLGGLDRPTRGAIFYKTDDISDLGEAAAAEFRNRHIGFVWQIHYLLPEFTALENVMMPLLIRGISRDIAAGKALDSLNAVGLATRAMHRSGELSGGEQQRVVLARALVADPALLLADEPTGNLDSRTGVYISDLLVDLQRQQSLTCVLVTHNIALAERCDRALRMEGGKLIPLS